MIIVLFNQWVTYGMSLGRCEMRFLQKVKYFVDQKYPQSILEWTNQPTTRIKRFRVIIVDWSRKEIVFIFFWKSYCLIAENVVFLCFLRSRIFARCGRKGRCLFHQTVLCRKIFFCTQIIAPIERVFLTYHYFGIVARGVFWCQFFFGGQWWQGNARLIELYAAP